MTAKLGPDGFPKKGLSKKAQMDWLAANPHANRYRFYLSQAAASRRSANLYSLFALAALLVAPLVQIVLVVLVAVNP